MNQILCIGSVNLDHTYQVPHIVRPGETIACAGYRRHWGGKGLNQALALARAGADAHLAARVSAADLPALAALGAENGLDTALTEGCASPTGHAVIQVDAAGRTASSSTPGPTPPWTAISSPPRWPPSARETCFSSRTRSATCPASSAPPGPGG